MRLDPCLGELKIGTGLGRGVEGALGRGEAKGVFGEVDGGFQLVETGDRHLSSFRDFTEADGVAPAVSAPAPGLLEALSQKLFLCDERIAASLHHGEFVTEEHDGMKDVALDVADAVPSDGPSDRLPPVTGHALDVGQVAKESAPRGDGSFLLHGCF